MTEDLSQDDARLRDVVTDVINEHVSPRLDQINGRVGKTEARVEALEDRVDQHDTEIAQIKAGSDERTTILKSMDAKLDQITIDLAPWIQRQYWWQRGKEYTVKGFTFSRRAVIVLGSFAAGMLAIGAALGQVPWI